MHRIRTFCFIFTLLAAPFCSARDLAVIVHKANPISTVNAAELEKVLKAAAPWPDGKR